MSQRLAWVVLAFAVSLVSGAVRGDDEAPARVIRYGDDKLTVHATKVPADDVLGEVAQATGAEIRGGVLPHDVTTEFDDVPLSDGLKRILGTQNFILKYGEGGKLRAIVLLGGPVAPSVTTVATVAHGVPSTTTPFTPGALQTAIAQHPPIPLSPHLAKALGAGQATVDQLLNAALHQDDAGVRQEAARTTLNAIESDPSLRTAFLGLVNRMDDAALGNILRGMSAEHAEEFVGHVAAEAKSSELRVKATSVLQQIRAKGG
jgi:hypothetical protein